MQGIKISMEEEKCTSVLYSDIVTLSIRIETKNKTSAIGNFSDKNYEQMALSNLKEELLF